MPERSPDCGLSVTNVLGAFFFTALYAKLGVFLLFNHDLVTFYITWIHDQVIFFPQPQLEPVLHYTTLAAELGQQGTSFKASLFLLSI